MIIPTMSMINVISHIVLVLFLILIMLVRPGGGDSCWTMMSIF